MVLSAANQQNEILQKFVSRKNDYRLHGLIIKYCYESGNPLCPARQ